MKLKFWICITWHIKCPLVSNSVYGSLPANTFLSVQTPADRWEAWEQKMTFPHWDFQKGTSSEMLWVSWRKQKSVLYCLANKKMAFRFKLFLSPLALSEVIDKDIDVTRFEKQKNNEVTWTSSLEQKLKDSYNLWWEHSAASTMTTLDINGQI